MQDDYCIVFILNIGSWSSLLTSFPLLFQALLVL